MDHQSSERDESKIRDRFDLTLEVIRRHYANEWPPLKEVLARYRDFFGLLESFQGFIDFSLLDDLVDKDGQVRFYLPFDGYIKSPLPATFDENVVFRNAQLDFRNSRTQRIEKYIQGMPASTTKPS